MVIDIQADSYEVIHFLIAEIEEIQPLLDGPSRDRIDEVLEEANAWRNHLPAIEAD